MHHRAEPRTARGRRAGVPAEYRCFAGQVHPFVLLAGLIDAAHDARRLIGERLREAFKR